MFKGKSGAVCQKERFVIFHYYIKNKRYYLIALVQNFKQKLLKIFKCFCVNCTNYLDVEVELYKALTSAYK